MLLGGLTSLAQGVLPDSLRSFAQGTDPRGGRCSRSS
ncbi:hypothetical protein [Nocardioides psychrotolerans]